MLWVTPTLQAQVHEYEGFNYFALDLDGLSGGTGWGSAWQVLSGTAPLSGDDVSLDYPVTVSFTPEGSRLAFFGAAEVERRLGTELPLNQEGQTYYFSALIKRQGGFRIEFARDQSLGGHVRWRFGAADSTSPTQDAILGVANDVAFADLFPINETVYVVVKMETHASSNDRVFMNIYRSGDAVPTVEPGSWQASAEGGSGVILTRFRIRNLEELPLEIDEIRIGASWLDVVGPLAEGAPVITTQPVSVANLYEGLDATFSVEASGALPLSYQWFKDGSPLADETNSVLVLHSATVADQGTYFVRVTNPSGSTDSDPVTFTVQNPSTDLNVGLLAKWPFDETFGLIANDVSGRGNNGTLVNFPGDDSQWIASPFGGALYFNGADYVEVLPPNLNLGSQYVNSFTLALWFKSSVPLAAGGSTHRMFEKDNSVFLLQGVGNGGMNALVKKGGGNVTAAIGMSLEANRWYHYVAWFNGSELRVYLDGQLVASTSVSAPIDLGGDLLRIGADEAGGNTRYFNGAIDEVGFWERPLLESEILSIAGRSGPPTVIDQPADQTKYQGATATLRVTALGAEPLRYLWFKGDQEIRSGASNVLVLYNVQPEDAGQYRCRVSNAEGEVFSDTATLTVLPVTDITDGQAALWKFDEFTGIVASDASGHGLDGQLVDYPGDTQWVPGKIDGGLAFDGAANRVVVANSESLDIGTDATFAFWINPTSYGTVVDHGNYLSYHSRVLHKGGHFTIELVDDPGSVRATLRVNGASAPQNSVELNVWQHFVVKFQGGQVYFYKNGLQLGDPVPVSPGGTNAEPIVIGNISATLDQMQLFQGTMDEVGIWLRPLSETEIMTLAGLDVTGPPVIVTQPTSATRYVGGNVSFLVQATGKRPLSYEWQHDGVAIPDSNTNRLVLTNLTVADAGEYTVRVANDQGEATSPPAVLTVLEITGITTGLIAYWPMDEEDGTVLADASGNQHDAAVQNGTATPVPGVIGGAFDFDGLGKFAIVPHADDLNLYDQATFSAWISPRTFGVAGSGGIGRILRKDINYDWVVYDPIDSLRFYGLNKATYDAPPNALTLNEWQHVAAVIKDGTIQFFRNGRALDEPQPGLLGPANTNALVLGNFGTDLTINRLFNGLMDDVAIWNRALTPQEIDGIYQNGLLGKPLNAPFEPLEIREISFPGADQLRLVFFSPFADRDHVIEWTAQLDGATWTEVSAAVTPLQNGLYEAVLDRPAADTAFFRAVVLPQTALYKEDFESGAPGWTHGGDGDNWELGTPVNGPGAAVSGVNVYATSLTGNINPYSNCYLRSPAIDLSGVNRATLSFMEWLNIDPDPNFHWTTVSILDADTLEVLHQFPKRAGSTVGYEERRLALPATVLGRSIIIEFRLECDAFNLLEGWYIDDVQILPE